MDNNETFLFYGNFDINNIIRIVNDNNLNWDAYTARQKKYSEEHFHTKTIPIIFDKTFNFNSFKIVPTENYEFFREEIKNLENLIEKSTQMSGRIIRAILVKLTAGKSIKPHIDSVGHSLVIAKRIHIPIVTNEQCFFTVGKDRRNLKAGELWEINNDKKMHSVENLGETDRIHMIVDWVEESILEKYGI